MDLGGIDRAGVVAPVPLARPGRAGVTRQQARGKRWRRSSRGLYVPAEVELTPEQRIIEAAAAMPQEHSAVTGWAGLRWMSALAWDGTDYGELLPVTVAVSAVHTIRSQPPTLVVSEERMWVGDRIVVEGLSVTVPARSACFEARYARDLLEATRLLDRALQTDLVSRIELAEYATQLNGWTGVPQCRDAIGLADENVWSPMETEMRLHWVLVLGITNVVSNHPVFDLRGRHVGTPDLLDLDTGLIGEYDGALHLEGRQRSRDITRESAFRALGLEPVTMVAADRGDLDAYSRRVLQACARLRGRQQSPRAWTVEPPPWWTPTVTVEQRRNLTQVQRERYLRPRTG